MASVSKLISNKVFAQPYQWPCTSAFDPATTALVIIDMQNDCEMPAPRPFAAFPMFLSIADNPAVCLEGGYLACQGLSIDPSRSVIPVISKLLIAFRNAHFPIYHTREGHRSNLASLSSRESHRSRLNSSQLGIGDCGPLGRFLVRGERGHQIIDELTPLEDEDVIDKPGRNAFAHTDFKLLLDNRGVRNLVICGVTTDVCVSSTMREGNDLGLDCLLVSDACASGVKELGEAAVRSVMEEGGIFGSVAGSEDVLKALAELDVDVDVKIQK